MSRFKNERRSLLKGVVATGAAASLPLSVSAALKPILDEVQKAEFPMPDFVSAVGDTVSIRCTAGISHTAEIAEVAELPFNCASHTRPGYLRGCASVVRFRVTEIEAFGNEVYRLAHPQLGKMDVLLSVVPDARGELGLEAVFN